MENPTLVVLTDRNDLDDSSSAPSPWATALLRQTPVQAESATQLRELLAVGHGRRRLHDDPEVPAGRRRATSTRCCRTAATSS